MEDENVLLNLQLPRSLREDFRIVAKHEGKSMSALIHSYIVSTVRKAKSEHPEIFPDHQPAAIVNESEFDRILYDAFDGRPIDDDTRRRLGEFLKAFLAVREIVPSEEK